MYSSASGLRGFGFRGKPVGTRALQLQHFRGETTETRARVHTNAKLSHCIRIIRGLWSHSSTQ